MNDEEIITAVLLKNQTSLVPKEPTKKFHNMWAFVLYFLLNSAFYGFLIYRRYTYHPLSFTSYCLIGKIGASSLAVVLSTFLGVIYIPHVISVLLYTYGGVDILFLYYSTSKYERLCCLLSFLYYIFFLLKISSIEEDTKIVLKESCYILWDGFGSCFLIVSTMTCIFIAMTVIFMNIRVFCIFDRIILYSLYALSLYSYISLCIYALKVYIYNYVMLTFTHREKRINESAVNTFYSLGCLTLSVYYNVLNFDCHVLEFISNYIISFISCIQELVISINTSYSMYLIGIHNKKLAESLIQSKTFKLSRNSENIKEQINVFLVLTGFLFMLAVNYIYAQTFKNDIFTFSYLYNNIIRSLYLDLYTNNVVTFLILTCSVCFFFSMFMVLISSSAISLLILFIENPEILRKANSRVHGMLSGK